MMHRTAAPCAGDEARTEGPELHGKRGISFESLSEQRFQMLRRPLGVTRPSLLLVCEMISDGVASARLNKLRHLMCLEV